MKYIYLILVAVFATSCDPIAYFNIEKAVTEQLEHYPKSQLADIYKNFYQGRFGSEHLVTDIEDAKRFTLIEMEQMDTTFMPMIEYVGYGRNFARVSLQMLKNKEIEPDTLSFYFVKTSAITDEGKNWKDEWKAIIRAIENNNLHLQIEDYQADKKSIDSLLQVYPKPAMRHSKAFNEAYKPHYRIIYKEFLMDNLFPISNRRD